MKKVFCCFLVTMSVFMLTSCGLNKGKTNNAQILGGDSAKFTAAEIKVAESCVLKKFKDFDGCNLKKLWYDEEHSDAFIDGYLSNGKGAENGVSRENVIVLLSDFHANKSGVNGGFTPNQDYKRWNWILIRDNSKDDWKADDWGY